MTSIISSSEYGRFFSVKIPYKNIIGRSENELEDLFYYTYPRKHTRKNTKIDKYLTQVMYPLPHIKGGSYIVERGILENLDITVEFRCEVSKSSVGCMFGRFDVEVLNFGNEHSNFLAFQSNIFSYLDATASIMIIPSTCECEHYQGFTHYLAIPKHMCVRHVNCQYLDDKVEEFKRRYSYKIIDDGVFGYHPNRCLGDAVKYKFKIKSTSSGSDVSDDVIFDLRKARDNEMMLLIKTLMIVVDDYIDFGWIFIKADSLKTVQDLYSILSEEVDGEIIQLESDNISDILSDDSWHKSLLIWSGSVDEPDILEKAGISVISADEFIHSEHTCYLLERT